VSGQKQIDPEGKLSTGILTAAGQLHRCNGLRWRKTLSTKKQSETDVRTPRGIEDTILEEKTAVVEDKDLETVIMRPSGPEPSAASFPETGSSTESEAPRDGKNERISERPAKSEPEDRSKRQNIPPEKKGAGMKNLLLGIFLLLVLGAGALVALHLLNPNSEVFKLLPFKWSAANQQQAVQTPSVNTQTGTPVVSQKYDLVEAGMTSNAVRQILGEPLRKNVVEQLVQWEYDTGTGLFEVKFRNDMVVSRNMIAYSETRGQPGFPACNNPPARGDICPNWAGEPLRCFQRV
jgi:hypothetical protein